MDNPDLADKISGAYDILENAIEKHDPSHVFGLFSGGHDSLTSTHIAAQLPNFSGAFHANTGIGIEQTREFVRDTCESEGWELVEYHATDPSYDDLVLEKGFPRGPKSHNSMYWYLKQKQIDRLIREHKESRGDRSKWFDRILLVTGIRRQESERRMQAKMSEPWTRDGAKVWVNPILDWTAQDCGDYIEANGLQRNEVVDCLHRSGECLCGAFANPNEIEEVEFWYPEAAQRIHELERQCADKGLVDSRWAVSQAPGKTWEEVDPEEINMQLCRDCVRERVAS